MTTALPPPMATTRTPPGGKPKSSTAKTNSLTVSSGPIVAAQRIGIFGPGGVGKTSLAMLLDGAVFIDVDGGTFHLDVRRVGDAEHPVDSWDALKAALLDESLWKDAKAVVIDSLTRAEEMAIEWTIANVPHEKGHTIKSIEGYGYGKGYQYVFETFLQLLALLDTHIRAGRHVICIAHECVANVPNPEGEDWIRYEPRLQSLASGKASIRHRFKEWADHLFFVGFDVFAKDGKAKGAGTRTICCQESPAFWAKSRSLADPIVFSKGDNALWTALFGRDGK